MIQQKIFTTNREWIWLAAILIAGILLRVIAIAGFSHTPESDEIAYQNMAINLLAGNGVLENGNRAFYNAGYPIFILAPVYYLFGDNILAARIANIFLGTVSIILCYFVAKEAGSGKIGRLLAAAIWALYLPTGIYSVYLAKENLMVPLILGVMWCTLRLNTKPSANIAVACGLFFGLLAMVGNSALSLVGTIAIALIIMPSPAKQRLKFLGGVAIIALLVSSPWMVRNFYVIGAPVMNTNGGFNLYLGNNPAATGFFVSISDTPRGATWHELRKTSGELGATETLKKEAVSWIKENPKEFVVLALKKGVYFWTPPFHEGKGGNVSIYESIVRFVWLIQFVLLITTALAGLFLPHLRNRQQLILWVAVACYTIVHMIFYVIFRYREPIMPVIGILAALAFEGFWTAKFNRKVSPGHDEIN
ncbi:MAG: glycosyltransferase family 39 protein [Azonexus sp.]|jgi:4-amino-4-deoxy-L-arabinose transferase-like glycosyltransferase|nr:glycosyltransferase family 39 protein [Azonexus sp.]